MNEDYLEHHGILGQRWGIRRYQNPDGTLTEKGKKRYFNKKTGELSKKGKEELLETEKQYNRYSNLKASLTKNGTIKKDYTVSIKTKIKLSDISDEDLQKYVNRLNNEKRFKELYMAKYPDKDKKRREKQEQLGKKFADKFVDEIVLPTSIHAGKSFINSVSQSLGGDSVFDKKDQ